MNKICPKCNTSNPAEANFCRHCGYEFQSVRVIKDGEGGDMQTDEIEQIRQKQAIDWEEKEMQYKAKQEEMQKKIKKLERQLKLEKEKVLTLQSTKNYYSRLMDNSLLRKRCIISSIGIIIAITILCTLMRNSEVVQSWLQIDYSSWQTLKSSLLAISWALLVAGIAYLCYAIYTYDKERY